MEKKEVDPYRDYFEIMSTEREANMNRQGYKRLKHDYYIKNGYDPELFDLDYAYDAGNEANRDILPAVSKKEDGSVTEDILLDTNTREGMAWAAASKVFYDAFYGQKQTASNSMATDRQGRRNQFNSKRPYRDAPKTPQEFGQWGIEKIGWLNYHLPALGYQSSRLPSIVKKNPKAAYAFLHLLNTYGELPMFTWNGTKRFFNGVLKDPTTYVGLGTLGIGLAGKKFGAFAGKGGLKKALRASIDPAAITMYEGALYAASDDFFRQRVAIEAGPGVEGGQEGYNASQGAFAAGAGALFSGGMYATAKVAPYAYDAVKGLLKNASEDAKTRIAERQSGTQLFSNPIGPIADEVISRIGGSDIPKNRNLDELGFYSKAEESLTNMQQQKGTGRQFLKMLENKFQVKQKELAQLGLNKFDNDEKVNKQELIDTIRTNYIKIRENKYINPKDKPDPDRIGNSIEFNLRNIETSDNWSSEVDDMIGSYERGMYADDDDFIDTMLNRIIPERLTFAQTDDLAQNQMTFNTYNENRDLLRQALMDGEPSYTDTAGNRISISDDVVEWMDEFAEAQYMANPRQAGGDTLGIGYRAEYDNLSNTYNVRDPEGYEIASGISSLDEAAVRATTHAYDNRHLLEPVIDDADIGNAEPINDPSIPSGAAIYSSDRWKIKGGENYRELVLSNSNYKGDPQAQEISAEMKAAFDSQQNTQALFKQASEEVQIYESLPDSDKEVYWNEGARSKRVLAASNEQEFYDLYKTVKQNSKDAFNKLKNLQIELNAPGDPRPMTDTAMGFDYDGLPVRSQNPLMRGPRTHYGGVENDMGHMRITDRMMDDPEAPTGQRDKKGMFVEELQSDWSQRGRYNFPTEANRARAIERDEVFKQSVQARDKILNTMQDVAINVNKFQNVDFPEYKNALRVAVVNDSAFYDRVGEEGMEVMEKIIDDITLQDVVNEMDLKTGLGSESVVRGPDDENLDAFANALSDIATPGSSAILGTGSSKTLSDFVDDRFAVAFDNALAKKVGDLADKQILSELDDEALESNPLLGPGGTSFSGFGVRMYPGGRLNSFIDQIMNDLSDLPETFRENFRKLSDPSGFKFDKARARYGLVPRGPFVEVTDDIVELQLKSLIRRAVDEGHDFIVIGGPEEQIDRWGEDYRKSFETHYNIVVPKVLDKLMKQFDKKNKKFRMNPQNIGITYAPPLVQPFGGVPPVIQNISGPITKDKDFIAIRITPEMRRTVKQGMSLFELGTIAGGAGLAVAGSQMTQQENTEPGI